ncbi:MAG: nucleotidyltransferase family protein [Nitrospirota bacterium]
MTKNEIINFIKAHKKELQEQLGVIKIGLFGSYARGDAREDSDVDIAVELSDDNRADNYFKLLHFFEDNLKMKIDLGIESCIKPAVKDNVQKEIIYV